MPTTKVVSSSQGFESELFNVKLRDGFVLKAVMKPNAAQLPDPIEFRLNDKAIPVATANALLLMASISPR